MTDEEYARDPEIVAIGVCMNAVTGLDQSEALRVLAYVASYIGAKKISEQVYAASRRAQVTEARERGDLP